MKIIKIAKIVPTDEEYKILNDARTMLSILSKTFGFNNNCRNAITSAFDGLDTLLNNYTEPSEAIHEQVCDSEKDDTTITRLVDEEFEEDEETELFDNYYKSQHETNS